MCTGISIGIALAAAAASTFTAFQQAEQQADAQNAALEHAYTEQTRLQEENNRIAAEEKLDRIRETSKQLGTIRASSGELGGGLSAFVIEAGALEGVDLSRIERNRKSQEDSLQAAKKAGHISTSANIKAAYGRATSTAVKSGFKAAGTGFQLADDAGWFDEPTTTG